MDKRYLTVGDAVCGCGNTWHFETLGESITCSLCRMTHKAIGEKIEYVEHIEPEGGDESDGIGD